MNTLKSAATVVVLAGVLYCVYIVLHQEPSAPPPGMTRQQVEEMAPPAVDFGPDLQPAAIADAGPNVHALAATPDDGASPAAMNSSPRDAFGGNPRSLPPAAGQKTSDPSSGPDSPLPAENPEIAGEGSSTRRSSYEAPGSPPLISDAAPRGSSDAASAAASPASDAAQLTQYNLQRDWQTVKDLVDDGKFRTALKTLTPYYNTNLAPEDAGQVMEWLDALAGKVIYSREHLLGESYKVLSARERLPLIAAKFKVSTDLLQKVNKIQDPNVLLPGQVLKIIPGPFDAEVNLARNEVTLFLGDLYAGRFPLATGNEPAAPGDYLVKEMRHDRTYYGPDGRNIPGNDPINPYGGFWIGLDHGEVALHGSPRIATAGPTRGCISLSSQDAGDIYAILTTDSRISIKR